MSKVIQTYVNIENYDATYHMERESRARPAEFPYTEVKTTRPDAEPDDLADNLLNWLAWVFVEPAKCWWVFRGIKRHDYRLDSSLDRRLKQRRESVGVKPAEDYLLSQFQKAAHHHMGASFLPDSKLEWLALMQHFGTPTRLLDFTRSPYVACFFALEELDKNKAGQIGNCAIWAIDSDWLVRNSFRRVGKTLPGCTEDSFLDSGFLAKHFDNLFANGQERLLLPVVPPRSNPRLLAQQGLFLCSGVAEAGFEKNLASFNDDTQDMADHVFKIIVEGRIRTELLSEFRLMNISRATLFPDLQGYAQSLANEIGYRSSGEIKRSR
jgi:hypothetical protein